MSAHDASVCAWCPRLCRHVCPVAVGTAGEAATPTAMRTLTLLADRGDVAREDALRGVSLCNGCGACTAFCALHVDVAGALRLWRGTDAGVPPAEPLRAIVGDSEEVCVIVDAREDWSGRYEARAERPVARLYTGDALGHAAWRHGDLGVPRRVSGAFERRRAVTDDGEIAAVLRAAGVPVRQLVAPAAAVRFVPCFEGPAIDRPDQLACCGRRERFAEREPDAAGEVAGENVRRLDGRRVSCDDAGCAEWLRAHGADVVGPDPTLDTAERR